MRLKDAVRYVNAAYVGFCIGLFAYITWLIIGGKTLMPKPMLTLSELFASTVLGPLATGPLPLLILAYTSFTLVVMTLNVVLNDKSGGLGGKREDKFKS